jgi:fimbrial isopeptide formation D2 family protein
VSDINGSWREHVSVDAGKEVWFRLTSNVPDMRKFEGDTYAFIITDTLGAEFSDISNLTIVFGGETGRGTITPPEYKYTLQSGDYTLENIVLPSGERQITINFGNMKDWTNKPMTGPGATEGTMVDFTFAPIEIIYSAVLISSPEFVELGAPNSVKLTYSNPEPGEPNITTPPVTVKVFTFAIDILKWTPNGAERMLLDDVEFTLYRGTIASENEIRKGITANEGKLRFTGLAGGYDGEYITYWLVESGVLPGYNPIDPKEIRISYTTDGCKYTELIAAYTINGEEAVEIEVENRRGILFPETGGIGRAMFYMIGALAVLSSGIALRVRYKLSEKKRQEPTV